MGAYKKRDGERHAADFYPTPDSFCQVAVGALDIQPKTILDPGAGDGAWGRAIRQRWPHVHLTGIDARALNWPGEYTMWHIARFEAMPARPRYDLIVGNPPFKYAETWIGHALTMLNPGGMLAFLLRLEFLGGKSHMKLLQSTPLAQVLVSSGRIHFTGDRPTNYHAMFIWQQGYQGAPQISWLDYSKFSRVYDERANQMSLFGPLSA